MFTYKLLQAVCYLCEVSSTVSIIGLSMSKVHVLIVEVICYILARCSFGLRYKSFSKCATTSA